MLCSSFCKANLKGEATMVDGVDEEIVNDQLLLEGWRHLYDHVIRLYLDGIMMSYFEKRVCIHGDPSAKETTLKRSSVFQTYFYANSYSLYSCTRSQNKSMLKLCLFLFSIPRWKTSFSSLVTSFRGLTKLAVLLKNKTRNNVQMLINIMPRVKMKRQTCN